MADLKYLGNVSSDEDLATKEYVDGQIAGVPSAANVGLNEGSTSQDPDDASAHVILTNHANTPNSTYYWHIITTFYSTKTSSSNRAQIAVQYNSGNSVYARSCYGGTWTAWARLDVGNIGVTAGNGLTGGGTLSTSRTITMGTPGSCTASTSNAVTSTSHTHGISGFSPIPTSYTLPVGFAIILTYLGASAIANNGTTAGSNLSASSYGSYMYKQSGTWKNIIGHQILTNGSGLFVRIA